MHLSSFGSESVLYSQHTGLFCSRSFSWVEIRKIVSAVTRLFDARAYVNNIALVQSQRGAVLK